MIRLEMGSVFFSPNDAHALMAPTLQPGVRRLPSPELLAELQQLANGNSLASVDTIDSNDPAPLPNAPLPLGVGFSAFWLGRTRKTAYGYTLESTPALTPTLSQRERK